MRGREGHNYPAFHEAALQLRQAGYPVVNPAELDEEEGSPGSKPWDHYMRRDLKRLMDCDGVATLEGWEDSEGAKLEVDVAERLGLEVLPVWVWLSVTGALVPSDRDHAQISADDTEVRVTSETGGEKGQKLAQLGALDPLALLEVAKVAGFGATKYARFNYLKGYDWSLSYDAAERHGLLHQAGEDRDPESGRLHAAHAAWHWMTQVSFLLRDIGTDDRPGGLND